MQMHLNAHLNVEHLNARLNVEHLNDAQSKASMKFVMHLHFNVYLKHLHLHFNVTHKHLICQMHKQMYKCLRNSLNNYYC